MIGIEMKYNVQSWKHVLISAKNIQVTAPTYVAKHGKWSTQLRTSLNLRQHKENLTEQNILLTVYSLKALILIKYRNLHHRDERSA